MQTDAAPAVIDPRPMPSNRHRYILFTEMLVFAALSLLASFVLSKEAITLAADPNAVLGCSINVWLDCAKVGLSPQANILGFPNAFLGMIAEPVVMTIAVASLSGVRFPKWFMFTANAVYLLGVIFAYWLLYESTFVLGVLCPWCLLVTLSTTFVFWSMTHWNILEGNLYFPPAVLEKMRRFTRAGGMAITLMVWLAVVLVVELLKTVLKVI